MPARTFTIDRDRLERFRAAADAARGESGAARDRVNDARNALREAKDELARLQHSHGGGPYLASARARVDAAQTEVARLAAAQGEGAAAREHVSQVFHRLDAYAKGAAR